jgi:hypothetical protein
MRVTDSLVLITSGADTCIRADNGSMGVDASAHDDSHLAVQGSGVQNNYYGVSPAQSESAVSIAPPFGRRDERRPVRGRDDLIAELVDAAGQVRVVYGLGGCGKTTLALEVAYQARQCGVEVWWVSAVEADSLVAGIRTVGRRLGVTDAELNRGDVCDVIWERLSARTAPWLLVLDNADDPQILTGPGTWVGEGRGWLRPVDSAVGQVLVTSRDGAETSWGAWCIRRRLPVLPSDQAAQVLIDRTGNVAGSDDEARALADRLGGLPLAVRIAGSYLAEAAAIPAAFAEPGLIRTFRQYQDALDAGDLDAVFRAPGTGQPSQDEARRLIGRTWDLSLDLLDARQIPEARRLLRLLACFADAPIPHELLLHPATLSASTLFEAITGTSLWNALQSLDGFGLVHLDLETQAAIPITRLHPLVRDTSTPRPDVTDGDYATYLKLAARLLYRAIDAEETGLPEDPPMWPVWQVLSPHILHLFEVLTLTPDHPEDAPMVLAHAANFAARYQAAQGLRLQAEALQRELLVICEEAFGVDHPNTLDIRHSIANRTAERGDYAGAEAQFRDVLAARARVLGPDHPGTLNTRHEVARMMAELGDHAGAEAEYRNILAIRMWIQGPDHPSTLTTRNAIAAEMEQQGDHAGAEAQFRDVLAARARVLGPDHPGTLNTRNYIAWMIAEHGDYAGAEAEYRDVLAARLRVQGPGHPDTLAARYEIARMMGKRGDHAGAESEYRDVLAARLRVLGPDHPDTLRTARNLDHLEQRKTP